MTISATGGTVTEYTSGGTTYKVHTFTSSGDFVVTGSGDVDYLVQAGGGAGGTGGGWCGGGGAGRLKTGTQALTAGTYPVVVGDGGVAYTGSSQQPGGNGGDSSALGVEADGGGGGACVNSSYYVGVDGGNGGGGAYYGTGNGPGGSSSDGGYAGGTGRRTATQGGGGGGGNGEAGGDASASAGGDGGDGVQSDITGTSTWYGGGGGGARSGAPGAGGQGGGGVGYSGSGTYATAGEDGKGGGGGGGYSANAHSGKNGGKGVVIFRYPTSSVQSVEVSGALPDAVGSLGGVAVISVDVPGGLSATGALGGAWAGYASVSASGALPDAVGSLGGVAVISVSVAGGLSATVALGGAYPQSVAVSGGLAATGALGGAYPQSVSVSGGLSATARIGGIADCSEAPRDYTGATLTDLLPLRTTADLGTYTERLVLPRVYGRCVLSPIPYDGSRRLWLVADHPIAGVDRVEYKGQEIGTWALHQDLDPTGRAVAVLETQAQIEAASDLRVTVRGAVHPVTGELLERADLILWDVLSSLGGLDLAAGRLDDLRAASASTRLGGVLDGEGLTIQGAVDQICQGAGLAWSWAAEGIAFEWPRILGEPTATLTRAQSPRLQSDCSGGEILTRLELVYDYDWSAGDFRASLTLANREAEKSSVPVLRRIEAGWLHGARDALAYATRYLSYHGRPVWTLTASAPLSSVSLGDTIAIDHPHCPLDSAILTTRTIRDAGEAWILEAALGQAPVLSLVGTAGAVDLDALEGPAYEYMDGIVTWLITDESGKPLAGAWVTLDGGARRTTDGAGYVQFSAVAAGVHTLLIQAVGHEDRTLAVTVA